MTKKGFTQYTTRVDLSLRLVHESGQWIEVKSSGEGQDGADKGTYQAITGARKYAIAMAANLVTSDDPEKDLWAKTENAGNDSDGRPKASADASQPEPQITEV